MPINEEQLRAELQRYVDENGIYDAVWVLGILNFLELDRMLNGKTPISDEVADKLGYVKKPTEWERKE